jgi:hypothetical protein
VYGSATWAVAEMDMKRLDTWKREILKSVYGAVVEQGICRKRTNQELRGLYKTLDFVADIKKKKKWEWIGNVIRMDQGRRVNKIPDSKLKGSRRRGRPGLRWL